MQLNGPLSKKGVFEYGAISRWMRVTLTRDVGNVTKFLVFPIHGNVSDCCPYDYRFYLRCFMLYVHRCIGHSVLLTWLQTPSVTWIRYLDTTSHWTYATTLSGMLALSDCLCFI